jgi:Family of unknown function (DUF6880)
MSKKTLNKINLEALGAERLASLLIEVSTGNDIIKRRLRLEISHNLGVSELAHDVRKRLVSLRKSTSNIGWRRRKALITDLSTQVVMITDKLAPEDPSTAFDLLWQFIEIAPSIYERVNDSRGEVGDVFRDAIGHFEDIAPRAHLDVEALAERVWSAVRDNDYGEWDGIIPLLAPTLTKAGLEKLRMLAEAYGAAPLTDDQEDHEAIQFLRQLRGESSYAVERKAGFVKWCLQEIATAAGDTDAYIAQYSDADLKRQDISAEVAMLLLADDFAKRALDLLVDADQDGPLVGQGAWDDAYIATLIALGQEEEAQAHRWACFLLSLNAQHLRDYLRGLPDFEDVEEEDRARNHVLEFPNLSTALDFCLKWPDLLTAAQLITGRADDINGNHCSLLTPAAEALRVRQPLAAVLLWRAMIDYTLEQRLAARYGDAAEHLMDCNLLDAEITDYGMKPDHAQYLEFLQMRHDHKSTFWAKLR